MNHKEVEAFKRVYSQLKILHEEMNSLSKKKEDGAVNKFKLKFINTLLNEANSVLGEAFLPFSDFRQFDEDSLPTNSDIVMMLAQYKGAFVRFKAAKTYREGYSWFWEAKKGEKPVPVADD